MRDRFSGLRRRCLSLGLGELAAAAVFAAAALMWQGGLDSSDTIVALWCALVPLLFVLVQAGAYWLLARSWITLPHRTQTISHRMPRTVAQIFRGLRIVNPIVLFAGLIGVVTNFPPDPLPAVLVLFVWAFGVAEYVNYYLVRLSYPWTRWTSEVGRWRTPRLLKDIRSAR